MEGLINQIAELPEDQRALIRAVLEQGASGSGVGRGAVHSPRMTGEAAAAARGDTPMHPPRNILQGVAAERMENGRSPEITLGEREVQAMDTEEDTSEGRRGAGQDVQAIVARAVAEAMRQHGVGTAGERRSGAMNTRAIHPAAPGAQPAPHEPRTGSDMPRPKGFEESKLERCKADPELCRANVAMILDYMEARQMPLRAFKQFIEVDCNFAVQVATKAETLLREHVATDNGDRDVAAQWASLREKKEMFVSAMIRFVCGEVRSPAMVARKLLITGRVQQDQLPVAVYAESFKQKAAMLPGESQETLAQLYVQGLCPRLKGRCAVMPDGTDWTDLESAISFSYGEEMRMIACSTAVQEEVNPAKKARLAAVDGGAGGSPGGWTPVTPGNRGGPGGRGGRGGRGGAFVQPTGGRGGGRGRGDYRPMINYASSPEERIKEARREGLWGNATFQAGKLASFPTLRKRARDLGICFHCLESVAHTADNCPMRT